MSVVRRRWAGGAGDATLPEDLALRIKGLLRVAAVDMAAGIWRLLLYASHTSARLHDGAGLLGLRSAEAGDCLAQHISCPSLRRRMQSLECRFTVDWHGPARH